MRKIALTGLLVVAVTLSTFPRTATAVTFTALGVDQTYTVPVTGRYLIEARGAGGGHDGSGNGGPGGYTSGVFDLTAGQVLSIVVGEGGGGAAYSDPTAYGFPGYSAQDGSGGGLSGVFTGSAPVLDTDHARALVIAGGGGGAGGTAGPARNGGPGNGPYSGGQSTMTGITSYVDGNGGAGGGGYYGGIQQSRTCCTYTGGEGGSGYVSSSAISSSILASDDNVNTPPNYITGVGAAIDYSGDPGLVVITQINAPPAQPTITASATGYVGQAVTVTLSGADDPENSTIRYAIDWDNNSTVDAYAPTSGYVADNSTQNTIYTWSSTGVKTYQARSEDSQGGVSAWVQKTITITTLPDAMLTVSSTGYREGDAALTLTWSSSGATSCTGTNFDTSGATSGSVLVTPTATTEYTLTCTNPGGSDIDSETVTYTANQAPSKPTISGPTTGRTGATYAYTITGTTPADPEGDPVRIGLDYNGDDIVDVWSEEW